MFQECMFCQRSLGTNEVLEEFTVGRRLVFDGARGRLWVVCRRCERWNLVPLEERWEAVEACERIFRETRLRVTTDNVGLARHPEGLELVRIGKPLRQEFAAWRYGDQFGRRRKKAILYGTAGIVVASGFVIGGLATGLVSGTVAAQFGNFYNIFVNGRTTVRLRTEDGRLLKLKDPEVAKTRIRREGDGWTLSLKKKRSIETFRGAEAERAAGILLPRINRAGGSAGKVRDAVGMIERAGHPERFLEHTVGQLDRGIHDRKGRLAKAPGPVRLALEMALHEDRERRALEGELKGLESIWRREEEIASISDDLFQPEESSGILRRLKDRIS